MNIIERECTKNNLNQLIDAWLQDIAGEIILPIVTENTAAHMATAALAVLDALQDVQDADDADDD